MLHKDVSLVTTFGREYIKGNKQLNKGDNKDGKVGSINNDAINQTGKLFGLGLDIHLSKNTNLYLRRRWMSQVDQSFVQDNIKGTETTIELKLFF
jgi:predicted porin